MKKFLACLTALLICVSLAVPALAAEADFVPSISVKPAPELVPSVDGDGNPVIATIVDADGNIIGYIDEGCLIITPVADADKSDLIPEAAKQQLLDVYNKLKSGEMTIPYDDHGADLDKLNMIIRDLFDVSWLCTDHPETVAPAGVFVNVTFDLGIGPDEKVYAMGYKDGKWTPVAGLVNNGDGSVTCTLEDVSIIEFSVEGDPDSSKTGDIGPAFSVWGLVALASLAAIVVLTVIYRKDAMKNV